MTNSKFKFVIIALFAIGLTLTSCGNKANNNTNYFRPWRLPLPPALFLPWTMKTGPILRIMSTRATL